MQARLASVGPPPMPTRGIMPGDAAKTIAGTSFSRTGHSTSSPNLPSAPRHSLPVAIAAAPVSAAMGAPAGSRERQGEGCIANAALIAGRGLAPASLQPPLSSADGPPLTAGPRIPQRREVSSAAVPPRMGHPPSCSTAELPTSTGAGGLVPRSVDSRLPPERQPPESAPRRQYDGNTIGSDFGAERLAAAKRQMAATSGSWSESKQRQEAANEVRGPRQATRSGGLPSEDVEDPLVKMLQTQMSTLDGIKGRLTTARLA